MNILERLQKWYQNNCNGNWEHQYGISIDTLDNPGWSISIDLKETYLESISFEDLKVERSEDNWITCRVSESKFEGFGGPDNLSELMETFLTWAEKSNKKKIL